MQYFNAIVKKYNHQNNKNLRFIYYQDLHSNCTTETERLNFSIARQARKFQEAETAEAAEGTNDRDYKAEAIARAKKTIKEIIRHNYNNNLKLLTLTYRNTVLDRVKVLNDIKNMVKRYKTHVGKDLRYIATLEWQKKRKCLHVHMIVDCPYISAEDWGYKYWLQGYIKINTISRGKSQSECMSAVSYVLKYIQKDADSCEYYDHLYYRSRNWNMKIEVIRYIDGNEREMIRYCNIEYGNDNYIMKRFFFENFNSEIINIIDVYPKPGFD